MCHSQTGVTQRSRFCLPYRCHLLSVLSTNFTQRLHPHVCIQQLIMNRLLYQHDVRRICHKLVRCKVSTTPSVRVLELNQKRLRWRGLLRAEFRFIRTHTGITVQTFRQTMPSLSFVYTHNADRGIIY